MPALLVLSIAIQAFFVIHVVKTGRDNKWIFVIMAFPAIGCLVYFLTELLPDAQRSRAVRTAGATLAKTIDPSRDLKRRADALQISDNVENRIRLAEECVATGLHVDAIVIYRDALDGLYEHDTMLLAGLANAYFQNGDFAKAKESLELLIEHNPEYKSADSHLLYAKSLEALGDTDAALHEYEVLAGYYPGAEAKCRYGLLLKLLGRTTEAEALFREIAVTAKLSPKHYRKVQKQWIELARQEI